MNQIPSVSVGSVTLRPELAEADDELGRELATQNTETLKPEANIARRLSMLTRNAVVGRGGYLVTASKQSTGVFSGLQ